MVANARPDGPATREAQQQASPPPRPAIGPHTWASLDKILRELVEYASYYVSARADRLRLGLLRAVVMLLLGATGALLGAALIATAGVLLLIGVGQLLGEAFGGRLWLGNIVTGAAFLLVVGGAVMITGRRILRSATHKTVQKYAERLRRQRREFGRDLSGRRS